MTPGHPIGESAEFRVVLALIDRVAKYDVPIVIEGETGTGKELVARAVHYGSLRRDHPFVPVNCGALPESLIERELFGHERGAFTDARFAAPGLVETARGGTLFLDEVDALPAHAQVALLRFLQDQTYRPLGARVDRRADVRVVAASNRSLNELASDGRFRADLLFRLDLLSIQVPPLRRRPGDAVLLARYFVDGLNQRYKPTHKRVADTLGLWLEAQPWPGNVRELEFFVHRQYLLTEGDELTPPQTDAPRYHEPDARSSLDYRTAKAAALAEFDRRFLEQLLRDSRGNVSTAAKLAHKERRALGKLIQKYGLRPDLYKIA